MEGVWVIGDFISALANASARFARWAFSFQTTAFVATTIASALAAYFGSYGASRYAEWKKERDELLAEIRNTDAAVMTAFTTCNLAINLKVDSVARLKQDYDLAQIGYLMYRFWRRRNPQTPPFHLLADLQSLPALFWPINLLQDTLFGKVTLSGKPLSAVATLSQLYHSLNHAIQTRNAIVEDLNARSPLPDQVMVPLYLGIPNDKGHVDRRIFDLIAAAYSCTDSCIYFSEILCHALYQHRIALHGKYRKKYCRRLPTVERPDFSVPRAKGLMPDPSEFESWEKWITHKQT